MANLNGKVALVTGASRGIGAAIAKRLAADGASVIVNYSHSEGRANEVVKSITAKGGEARAVQADMGDLDQIKHLFDETLTCTCWARVIALASRAAFAYAAYQLLGSADGSACSWQIPPLD